MQRNSEWEPTYREPRNYDSGLSYAEGLQPVRSLYDDIKTGLTEEELRTRNRLSFAFRIPVEIIDEYLCFGEYISGSVLKTLAEAKIDKNFFDQTQTVKQQLIKIYRHDGLSDQQITVKVSQAILDMYREYTEKGKLDIKDWQRFYREKDI